eukprot:335739-Chlamydomonas_euryale.AAC.4
MQVSLVLTEISQCRACSGVPFKTAPAGPADPLFDHLCLDALDTYHSIPFLDPLPVTMTLTLILLQTRTFPVGGMSRRWTTMRGGPGARAAQALTIRSAHLTGTRR